MKDNRSDTSSATDELLNFFEDLGFYMQGDQLTPEVAHHAFHHWIRGYYSAAQKYLEAGQEMEPSQWEFVKLLFDVTNEVEQEKVRKTATSDSLLDSAEIADFLRMDLAVLIPGNSKGARLVFCEAKCADNVELWKPADKKNIAEEPRIAAVSQITKYETFIGDPNNNRALIDAYVCVCRTSVDLREQGWKRKLDPLIEDVAKGAPLTIHPNVYLRIYDFDADQKKGAVQKRRDELRGILGHRVIAKGNPGSFSLSNDILRREVAARK